MKGFNVKKPRIETATALGRVLPIHAPSTYPAYIGLDVHKEAFAVSVGADGMRSAGIHR